MYTLFARTYRCGLVRKGFSGMIMKRRTRVEWGSATLALALVAGTADAWGAKGQTTDSKVACDEPSGSSSSSTDAPNAAAVGRIARCFIERGQEVQAAEHLRTHLNVMEREGKQGGRAALESLLKTALKKVGTIDIKTPPEAEIMVDGRLRGKSPDVHSVFVEPGPHVIEARKNGVEERQNIDVGAGNTALVELPLRPKKVEPPKPIVVPPKAPAWQTPTIIVGSGAALVGMILGAASVAAAQQAEDNRASIVASFPPGSSKCVNVPAAERCRREAEMAARGDRAWQLAGLGFTLGGLGIAALTTALVWPKQSTSPEKNARAVSATLLPLEGGAGVVLHGAF